MATPEESVFSKQTIAKNKPAIAMSHPLTSTANPGGMKKKATNRLVFEK
jgi:hypothetical protein